MRHWRTSKRHPIDAHVGLRHSEDPQRDPRRGSDLANRASRGVPGLDPGSLGVTTATWGRTSGAIAMTTSGATAV